LFTELSIQNSLKQRDTLSPLL